MAPPGDDRMDLRELTETQLGAAARALGQVLQPGDLVLLSGPMGAGKTTWTRALATGLQVTRPDRVCSPTFNICLEHAGPRPLTHIDLFRLAEHGDDLGETSAASVGAAAFEALGLEALLDAADARSVVVVEWGELWRDVGDDHLRLQLAPSSGSDDAATQRRDVVATASGARHHERLRQWAALL